MEEKVAAKTKVVNEFVLQSDLELIIKTKLNS